ncbi:MAG: hypothetical protein H8E37_08250, partial [Planctomycetes bacterium]|nr:hypothetical protein [Planctomycetota bacterium]
MIEVDWNWELRLFCSADIVGSMAFKATTPETRTEWASTFSEFFHFFPQRVAAAYANLPVGFVECSSLLEPWKFSGDEILFSCPVQNHRECVSHARAFKEAVGDFPNENWVRKGTPLTLKATAWIAGFPVTNRKVQIPGSNAVDYIGPWIDLGFRIAKFATPRKFVVSASLALLLLDGIDSCELKHGDASLFLYLD